MTVMFCGQRVKIGTENKVSRPDGNSTTMDEPDDGQPPKSSGLDVFSSRPSATPASCKHHVSLDYQSTTKMAEHLKVHRRIKSQ